MDVTARVISFVGQCVYEWDPVELHNQSLFPCVLSVSTPPHYWQTAPPVVSLFPRHLRLLILSAREQKGTETPMKWRALFIAHLPFGWTGGISHAAPLYFPPVSISFIALIAWFHMDLFTLSLCRP